MDLSGFSMVRVNQIWHGKGLSDMLQNAAINLNHSAGHVSTCDFQPIQLHDIMFFSMNGNQCRFLISWHHHKPAGLNHFITVFQRTPTFV